ncbi:MAG: hypothetical protein PWP17_103 [Desulfomicrobiaceae bacterium]|nr:hypothetical protein [Desulfomicrobiaceae bacterium]
MLLRVFPWESRSLPGDFFFQTPLSGAFFARPYLPPPSSRDRSLFQQRIDRVAPHAGGVDGNAVCPLNHLHDDYLFPTHRFLLRLPRTHLHDGYQFLSTPRVKAPPSSGFPELRLFHISGSPKSLGPRNGVGGELLLAPWAPRQTCAPPSRNAPAWTTSIFPQTSGPRWTVRRTGSWLPCIIAQERGSSILHRGRGEEVRILGPVHREEPGRSRTEWPSPRACGGRRSA